MTNSTLHIRSAVESDLAMIRSLLESSKLPLDILDEKKGDLWVFEGSEGLMGCGAFEFYGEDALLRSVAIQAEGRNAGLGTKMVDLLEAEAARRGVRTVWLLTETAEKFFARRGYEKVDRSVIVNKGLLDSAEFKHLCASTAVCMRMKF